MQTLLTLLTINSVDQAHLDDVIAQMRTLGAPSIRVVDCGDYYMAIEGSHRLAAAAKLSLAPDLVVLEQDELVATDSLDWGDDLCQDTQYTAGELAGEIYNTHCGIYHINNDGTIAAI